MRLYLDLTSSDLLKAMGAPPTGGGANGASGLPKTPGAATGGSGVQVVDCPLGPACPDGGHHQLGSTRLQEHTAQAAQQMQTGQKPGDESQGDDTGKPGVPPGATNLGGVGSDQVQRTPPPVETNQPPPSKTRVDNDTVHDVGEEGVGTRQVDPHSEIPGTGHDENAPDTAQTMREMPAYASEDMKGEGPGSKRQTLHDQVINLDPNKTRQDVPNPLANDESQVPPDSKPIDHYRLAQVARESGDEEGAKFQEGMARKRTDGMGSEDHKELANQLHKEGMHDQAAYHENIHSRVSSQNGSNPKIGPNGERFDLEHGPERDKEMRQRPGEHFGEYRRRLEKEHGYVTRPSDYDENMSKEKRQKFDERKKKVESDFKERKAAHAQKDNPVSSDDDMHDVHHEAKSKAEGELKSAKEKHAKLQEKAEELKKKNKEALDKYESDKAEHAKAKSEGKKRAAPKKPKLEKEEEVPEKPELSEPETEGDKLRHETHTSKAKRVADMAESHLKNNKTLSTSERARLERAHKMAVHHANIGYTPTAAHKKELGDIESAVSDMGIKGSYDDQRDAEDAKVTAAAAQAQEKDRAAEEKNKANQDKVAAKDEASKQKQAAKDAADQPQPPQTDLDHARVADHQGKAKDLREKLEQHMAQNPDMSPEEQEKAQRILTELEKHENLDMVPGKAHTSELKELQSLAGDHGKEFKPEAGGEGGAGGHSPVDTGGNYAMNMIHQGRALGHGLAASATSPHGAAGQAGSQVINYGVSGATHAGHALLHNSHQMERERLPAPPPEKEAKDKTAKPAATKGQP